MNNDNNDLKNEDHEDKQITDIESDNLNNEDQQHFEDENEDAHPDNETENTDSETIIHIGDNKNEQESEEEEFEKYKDDPDWFKKFRSEYRNLKKENQKLKQNTLATQEQEDSPKPLPKPSMESCDYDEEEFEKQLSVWHENTRQIKEQQKIKEQEDQKQQQAWNERVQVYNDRKKDLRVSDYEDCEDAVRNLMNVTQQGIIVKGSDNAANVVYALGKNPSIAKKLSEITDPIDFAFAIAKLESQLKVSQRKPSTLPEKVLKTAGKSSSKSDAMLEKLQAEADRTGDRSKVIQYNREKRKQSA